MPGTPRRIRDGDQHCFDGHYGGTWLLGVLSPAPRYFLASEVLLSFSVLMFVLFTSNTVSLGPEQKEIQDSAYKIS
jgi:hypothetical protein